MIEIFYNRIEKCDQFLVIWRELISDNRVYILLKLKYIIVTHKYSTYSAWIVLDIILSDHAINTIMHEYACLILVRDLLNT